ncbi:MAG: PHP domain-containing protein [Clostridia bacterium]|nr:PHP domain-containing protein [Clostridia bacterium]
MIDIDLHIHTNFSDGIESPERTVRRAQSVGLRTIAITDHDGVGGVKLACAEGEKVGVKVISGVEFSATFFYPPSSLDGEDYSVHILGYGIDLENQVLTLKMKDLMEKRASRNKKMQEAFSASGIALTQQELMEDSPSGYVGKASFARAFVKKGLVQSPEEAFLLETLMENPSIKAIRKDKTQAEEAIRIIHEAGGKAFLAHPFQLSYKTLSNDPKGLNEKIFLALQHLKKCGLDGVECYYPTHDQEKTDYLISLADQIGLLVSVGSDDHGPNVRKIKKMHSFRTDIDLNRLKWIEAFL